MAISAFPALHFYSTIEKSYFVHKPWKSPQFLGDTFQPPLLKNGCVIPQRAADDPVNKLAAGIPDVPAPVTEVVNPCTYTEL